MFDSLNGGEEGEFFFFGKKNLSLLISISFFFEMVQPGVGVFPRGIGKVGKKVFAFGVLFSFCFYLFAPSTQADPYFQKEINGQPVLGFELQRDDFSFRLKGKKLDQILDKLYSPSNGNSLGLSGIPHLDDPSDPVISEFQALFQMTSVNSELVRFLADSSPSSAEYFHLYTLDHHFDLEYFENFETARLGTGFFQSDSDKNHFAAVNDFHFNGSSLVHREFEDREFRPDRADSDSLSSIIATIERSAVVRKKDEILLALNDFLQKRDMKNRFLSLLAQRQLFGQPFPFFNRETSHYAGLNPLKIQSTLGGDFPVEIE